jgi:hypothetical protein
MGLRSEDQLDALRPWVRLAHTSAHAVQCGPEAMVPLQSAPCELADKTHDLQVLRRSELG